jgi:hypothetical protein
MAAGLGFKNFTSGEVLTAADVNGYLMQGILVFASATARDAAITTPQEGQFAFLKDTNVTTYYTGSAWANVDTTGMSNPMTTTGDTIYSSSGSTPARLGIGTAGQVLTVNSGATAPEWASPAAGGMTLLSTTTLSGASVTISSIDQTYTNLQIFIYGVTNASGNGTFRCAPNANTGITNFQMTETLAAVNGSTGDYLMLATGNVASFTSNNNVYSVTIDNYSSTASRKSYRISGGYVRTDGSSILPITGGGFINTTTAISSLVFSNTGGNLSTGTVLIYGVK